MSDRVAFVTGAGNGIGAAVAGRLAAECAVLVLVDRDAEAVAEVAERLAARGVEVLPAVVDVSDAAAMDATVDDAVDRFGRLDVAVNNAGVTGPLAELVDYPDGAFWRVQQINVGGVLNGMRAQLRHMVTFMIDLQQVSLILKLATRQSLVIIDEFGKGTDLSGQNTVISE